VEKRSSGKEGGWECKSVNEKKITMGSFARPCGERKQEGGGRCLGVLFSRVKKKDIVVDGKKRRKKDMKPPYSVILRASPMASFRGGIKGRKR